MRAAAFEFIFCNHFHILSPINLWDNRILSCSLGFESGFTGFRRFLLPARWLRWCALQLLNSFFSIHFHILSPINHWDNRILSCSLGFESGFTRFRGFLPPGSWLGGCALQLLNSFFSNHFHILFPINLWDKRVLSCSLGLNQDLQDFEDFYHRGVGWDDARCSIKINR